MHALRDRAVRDLLGIDERSAAATAKVSRHSLREHDKGTLKSPRCRALLEAFHADLRTLISRAADRARDYDEVAEAVPVPLQSEARAA